LQNQNTKTMRLTYKAINSQNAVPQSLPFGEFRRGCYSDAHGNTLTMPHLTSMVWDYLDQLHSAANGTFTSYYNYDAEGKRSRKVVIKNNIREERYYIGDYEVYRKYINNVIDTERTTLNINDDEKRFAIIDTLTVSGGQTITPVVTIRYQYDNHLGSACLELDENASIISYEEYHPFGTTSYRSGRTQTEVSLKRYKYCGKERDEETGLYYYGMRYYAAWICRFVSVDPLQFKYPELTPFQYASNRPITMIDIDGGEAGDPKTGKISGTVYLKFDTDTQLSQEDKKAYIDKFKKSIMTDWNNAGHEYNGQNVSVEINVLEAPSKMNKLKLKKNESLLTVGGGENAIKASQETRTSYINKNRKTGYMYYDNQGVDAGHEFGHLLGLSDRYIRLLRYYGDENKNLIDAGSISLYLKDNQGAPNMYGGSGNSTTLTNEQLSIVFSNRKERTYRTPVIIVDIYYYIPEGSVAKVKGSKVILGRVNSHGNFYEQNSVGSASSHLGAVTTEGLGKRTEKGFWTANKALFRSISGQKERVQSNKEKVRFFAR